MYRHRLGIHFYKIAGTTYRAYNLCQYKKIWGSGVMPFYEMEILGFAVCLLPPLEDGLLFYTSGFLLCRFERILGFWVWFVALSCGHSRHCELTLGITFWGMMGEGTGEGWDLRCKAGLEAGDFLVFDGETLHVTHWVYKKLGPDEMPGHAVSVPGPCEQQTYTQKQSPNMFIQRMGT